MRQVIAIFFAGLSVTICPSALAQSGEIAQVKELLLRQADVPDSSYRVVFETLDITAGKVPRHSHPGPTFVYVLEGGFTLLLDGQPPRTFRAGDSFLEPAGAMHEGFSDTPSKIMVVFVTPKGGPLVTPAK